MEMICYLFLTPCSSFSTTTESSSDLFVSRPSSERSSFFLESRSVKKKKRKKVEASSRQCFQEPGELPIETKTNAFVRSQRTLSKVLWRWIVNPSGKAGLSLRGTVMCKSFGSTHSSTHTHTHKRIYIYAHTYTYTHMCVHTHTLAYTHIHIHT